VAPLRSFTCFVESFGTFTFLLESTGTLLEFT